MSRFIVAIVFLLTSLDSIQGQSLTIDAPDNWRREGIKLPPEFAPEMKLKGSVKLRFSPGMFDQASEQFFTYVYAFEVDKGIELNRENLKQALLQYYGGLSVAVSKARGATVDPQTFKLNIKDGSHSSTAGGESMEAELQWIEPFVTGKDHKLYLAMDLWTQLEKKNVLFVCASGKPPGDNKVWNELRAIEKKFANQIK